MTGSMARAVAVVLAIGLAGCGLESGDPPYTGYVEAEFVYVAAPTSGWIVDAPVREGDSVATGTLLFALDADLQEAEVAEARDRLAQAEARARDMATGARREEIIALEAQLAEAEAALRLAGNERTRWTTLVERGVASKARADQAIADYDSALARVRTARANIRVAELAERDAAREAAEAERDAATAALAQAKWRLGQRMIEAQAVGRVEEVFHRAGEYVTAGAPVLALLPENAIKVRFFLPQAALSGNEIGGPVHVVADGRPEPLDARVSHIAREAEFTPPVIYSTDSREKLVFLVEAHLDNPAAVRPGQPVDVRLP